MIRRPPRSTQSRSSAASDVYKRQLHEERAAALKDRASRPFGRAEVEALSAAVSMASGRPYGVRRVCVAWGLARSTFYAAPPGIEPARRGPAPAVCDEELYALIADDPVSYTHLTLPT